jgi:LuxR family maltose regulon positive regulatory protein
MSDPGAATAASARRPLKFSPSTANGAPLERAALNALFCAAGPRTVFLLHGIAGAGKTHVLAQWAEIARGRGATACWINLQPAERDPRTLVETILTALGLSESETARVVPRFKDASDVHFDASLLAERLCAALREHEQEILLVLDDYHRAESAPNNQLLQELCEQMPANLKLAIASRLAPTIAVSRILLQGRLHTLDRQALAFTRNETKAFFETPLSPARLREILNATGGWPAAVRIAQLSLDEWNRTKGPLTALRAFQHTLREYLATEILAALEPQLLELLVDTSLMEVIEPAVANAIIDRPDGAEMLQLLCTRYGLVEPVDSGAAYRVPAPIRSILLQRLQTAEPSHRQTVHVRAAAWFERTGAIGEAIRHYVSADRADLAARALERVGPLHIMIAEGDARAARIIELLPQEQLAAFPRVALAAAFVQYKQGFVEEASCRLAELARSTQGFTVDRADGDNERLWIEGVLVELVMQVYRRSNVTPADIRKVENVLAPAVGTDLRLSMAANQLLGVLHELRGDLQAATQALIRAEMLDAKIPRPWWTSVWLNYHRGSVAIARGQLQEGRYQLQKGLKRNRDESLDSPSFCALSQILLAEIDYETQALAEARRKIEANLWSVEHVECWFDNCASGYETAAMLAYHRDGADGAAAVLARAEGIERVRTLLRNFLPMLRARIAALDDNWSAVRAIVDQSGLVELWQTPGEENELCWREFDLAGIVLCQLALGTEDFGRCAVLLDRFEHVTRQAGRLRGLARALVLRAVLNHRQGGIQAALPALTQALEIGRSQGYVRLFLDEARMLRPVLRELLETEPASGTAVVWTYGRKLLQAMPDDAEPSSAEPPELFSAREREVLRQLMLGHSNKAIGRKLGLTEPTVKFHLRNIFRKLEVRKRTLAVAIAQQRGLLS